ncbi:MAG: hypothetical protein KDA25_12795 [Phycisphaerales bacterium]|nr:hypothetical protein [Phycisphaerales bacterium]
MMAAIGIGALLLLPSSGAAAAGEDECLVFNGDAEVGTMDGWTPDDQIEIATVASSGTLGLPGGYSLGRFVFTGSLGPETESCLQSIDVSAQAAAIDAGRITADVSGALQARSLGGGAVDSVVCSFAFKAANGAALASLSFVDASSPPNVFDWDLFSDTLTVPAGTRSVEIRITMTRSVGLSTDAFADNICLTLSGDRCPADFDGSGDVAAPDLAALLAAWGACASCPEDLDGDGTVGASDLAALLAAWGSC